MKRFLKLFIESMLTFIAFVIYENKFLNTDSYSMLITLLFFIILYLYSKYDVKYDTKNYKYSLILSIILSIILSVGNIYSRYMYSEIMTVINLKNVFLILVMFLGLLSFFHKLFMFIFIKFDKISLIQKNEKMNLKSYILIAFIIFAGNLLYFIRFYPAIMSPDSYYVINYANNFILSDFHTFGHTWFFGVFFHLGKMLFNNLNMAVGFSTLVQMLCISLLFSISIKYLYEKGISKKICFVIAFIYGFTPLFGHYSVTLWRDVMFGTAFVPLFIFFYELVSCDKLKKKYIALFVISILIILFFRNNGIYIYLFMLPFIVGIAKKERKTMTVLCLSMLIFYVIIKGPVFNYFEVAKSKTSEAYSIPLQQMARVIALNKNIDQTSEEYLKKVLDYDNVSTSYRNLTSDPIKAITNNDYLKENNKEFFQTYFRLLVRNPITYVEAYLFETIGYWFPDVVYGATGIESSSFFDSEIEIKNYPISPNWYNKIIDATTLRGLPFANLIWSVGLSFIILLISSFFTAFYNKKYLLCYVPLYGLWFSIMAATPVFCELRYVYGIFTCIPLLVIIPFIVKQSKIEKGGK